MKSLFKRKSLSLTKFEEDSNQNLEIESNGYNESLTLKEDSFLDEEKLQRQFERDKFKTQTDLVQQGLQITDKIVDVWKYSKIVEQNVAQIQGATAIELAKISAKFQNQQTALMGIFGQRQQGLSAQFTTLEKALQENDRELIIESLRGISTIVTSNPLEDFEKLAKAWEDKSKPLELDF